ncbi:MAG: hypothetical protein HYT79_09300 [Elusimicrobia bacterium]|nr:hypothetical protein [Elusimicrobiota bacterium]
MVTAFSRVFAKLRKEAGFETAYQFFHKNGGAKVFKCSFPNYLRIEKGTHLPQPKRLPLLCTLLRLPLKSNELKELILAYLTTWLGSKDLTDWVLGPFTNGVGQAMASDPGAQALRKVIRDSAQPLALAQYETIMKNRASYWCYRVLTSAKEPFGVQELTKLLGLRTDEIQTALTALEKQLIVKKTKNGRYESPLAGQFLVFPDSNLISKGMMDRVFQYNAEMIKKKGELLDVRYCGVRADTGKIQGFVPHFRDAIRSVNAYAVTEKTDQSALVFVEGRVYKLFDF